MNAFAFASSVKLKPLVKFDQLPPRRFASADLVMNCNRCSRSPSFTTHSFAPVLVWRVSVRVMPLAAGLSGVAVETGAMVVAGFAPSGAMPGSAFTCGVAGFFGTLLVSGFAPGVSGWMTRSTFSSASSCASLCMPVLSNPG